MNLATTGRIFLQLTNVEVWRLYHRGDISIHPASALIWLYICYSRKHSYRVHVIDSAGRVNVRRVP